MFCNKEMTDIGAAGPIAGFLTAFPLLFVANYLQGSIAPVNDFIPYFLKHPPALDDNTPVGKLQIAIGTFALFIFLISFTYMPFYT